MDNDTNTAGTRTPPPNHHADHAGFSGISGLIAALTMSRNRQVEADIALELAACRPGDRVVDIGCGPGAAVRRAAGIGAVVTGVDPATVMLRVARVLDRSGSARYLEGVAEALPLDDDEVDAAIALATVHHWPDLPGALAEIARVLVPGGRFVALEREVSGDASGLASHGWTLAQAERFAEMARASGFSDAAVVRRPGSRGTDLVVVARR